MTSLDLGSYLTRIPDYPSEGIIFVDITTLLSDADAYAAAVDSIAEAFAGMGVTKVLGAEARGFMIGAPVAYRLHAGFVPARKPGKLPRDTYTQGYTLEYGVDALQVHKDAFTKDDVVLIVDDLLATGGTAIAQYNLVQQTGAKVIGMGFLIELAYLDSRSTIAEKTDPNLKVFSAIQEH